MLAPVLPTRLLHPADDPTPKIEPLQCVFSTRVVAALLQSRSRFPAASGERAVLSSAKGHVTSLGRYGNLRESARIVP